MLGGPWAVCDRCGFKVRHRTLRKEWTTLLVCPPCYDPRPADTRPPVIRPEGFPIPNARPEPEPIFVVGVLRLEDSNLLLLENGDFLALD